MVFASRYYEDNFKKQDIDKGGGLPVMLREYVKGLCWVLKYYYTVSFLVPPNGELPV
jgi:5'-3' exonuclease